MNGSLQANPLRSASVLFLLSLLMLAISVILFIIVGRTALRVQSEAAALDTVNALLVIENTTETGDEGTISTPVSFYYVGYIRTQRNDVVNAEKALLSALELDSQFYHAMAALGYVYRRIGETTADPSEKNQYYRKSETYLKRALAADDRLVDADGESWYGSLAGLYRRMGRLPDAFAWVTQLRLEKFI
ncbi:MAG: hypothetical protein Q9P01_07705 [Anaerolineae bacterium]|nr:hypothetical protein [Anaerolineae bacterium]